MAKNNHGTVNTTDIAGHDKKVHDLGFHGGGNAMGEAHVKALMAAHDNSDMTSKTNQSGEMPYQTEGGVDDGDIQSAYNQ